ncbi:MAG: hypothetical protein L3J95_00660 [Thermoplasmata archaeon]|nr:hypothetical protein [Thermoplasmata archaeon]MCI4358930.1 hypothetical protein [Thermoplasmata archaeon]
MNGTALPASAAAGAEETDAPAARPVAVVWCRQVDNEEESPGYTTIPEEFPGQRETVDTVRAVGHLAINVSDTHDYWDPDPGTSLSYYPNLFLYPAYRGEYTCVGRMFLSKEDRPRLGMKTLVLPTQELQEPETFGPAVLRWHASMGGLRKLVHTDRSSVEPGLYDRVGEGFLFHRGTTDPVLLVASERWGTTMEVLLELIRSLPAALTSLSGILAFPYFLPQARTDMKELQDRVPLTLAVMRVSKTEATGPRHDRRVQSWQTANLTVRDLTSEDLPSSGPRGKDPMPLVLQYVRDHSEEKLLPIRQRVDLVELPRQRGRPIDLDRQAGRLRRKECWRIGTAMESAALLLQRSRGRTVPVTGETAKRAQEYLRVSPVILASAAREADAADPSVPRAPSGLGLMVPPRAASAEAVPIPTRDDPSLLPRTARAPMLGLAVPVEGTASLDEGELRRTVRDEMERRLAELTASSPASGGAADPVLRQRVEALTNALGALPTQLDARLTESLQQHQLAMAAMREELLARTGAEEAKMRASFAAALAPEIDRRVRQAVEPKLAEAVREEAERSHRTAMGEVERAIAEMHQRLQSAEEETRATLTSQLDRHLRDAADRELTVREATEGRLKESLQARFVEAEARLSAASADTEEQHAAQLEARIEEAKSWMLGVQEEAEARGPKLMDERLQAVEERWSERGQAQASEIKESYTQAVADLQVRFEQHIEDRIREAEDAEREKYLQLFARLKEELDVAAVRRTEAANANPHLPKAVEVALAQRQKEALVTLEHRLATAEERLHVEQSEGIQRLEKLEELLGEKSISLTRLEEQMRADIQELDHRTQLLTDRLIPVVRKAWLKIAELQQTPALGPGTQTRAAEARRELLTETRRLEAEMDKRIAEMRHRVESAISHQGRIWLTLVHHLKELADERTMAATGIAGESVPVWQEAEASARDPNPPPIGPAPVARPIRTASAASAPKSMLRKSLRRTSED